VGYGRQEHTGDEGVADETAVVDCSADLCTLAYFGRVRRCREEIAVTTQPTQIILINGFGVLFVIFNAFGLGLRLPIGKLLAQAVAHWQIAVWGLVINFVIIPLLFIGYLLTIASSVPGEVKVGFCIAALSAGMPFAPLVARLAKANAGIATLMLVVLTVATCIALPLGLPLAIDIVDVQLKVSVWDIAWPLLVFLLLPLALGCGFRLWWPDLAVPLRRWVIRIAILCLLLNLNFTLYVYWPLFAQTWSTVSYLATLAGPFIGLGCGYLLVSGMRIKNVGIRHAAEITTAIRNIGPMLLMMIYPFGADSLVTVAITILNTIGLVVVLAFALAWRRALSPAGVKAGTARASLPEETLSQPSSGEAPA
jgi:BASS family bile acid:Na+ symporter